MMVLCDEKIVKVIRVNSRFLRLMDMGCVFFVIRCVYLLFEGLGGMNG